MSLEAFLHSLHFDIVKASPPGWEVDWADKPYAYKLYRGLPVVPLSPEVPLTLEAQEARGKPGLRDIGHLPESGRHQSNAEARQYVTAIAEGGRQVPIEIAFPQQHETVVRHIVMVYAGRQILQLQNIMSSVLARSRTIRC